MVRALKFARSPNRQLRRLRTRWISCSPLIPDFSHYSRPASGVIDRAPRSYLLLADRFNYVRPPTFANVLGAVQQGDGVPRSRASAALQLRDPRIGLEDPDDR